MAGYYAEIDINNVDVMSDKTLQKRKNQASIKNKNNIDEKISFSKRNARKIASFSLSAAALANSTVGSYTGNKLRQSNNETLLTIAGIGVAALFNPTIAGVSATSFVLKNTIDKQIRIINSRQESNYNRSYKGNMTTSGSRWRGGM